MKRIKLFSKLMGIVCLIGLLAGIAPATGAQDQVTISLLGLV